MARRNRLHSLQRLAEFTEAENSRLLADQLRALDGEERRLTQIHSYLAEYADSTVRQSGTTTVGALRGQRNFVDRLREAAKAQTGAVEQQRQQVEQQTGRWRTARSRAAGLQRLAEKADQREEERRGRIEQARLDEVGSRQRGSR